MSDKSYPIAAEATICQTLRCLPQKFLVDFVNGIEVARDNRTIQIQRSGSIFQRMYDGFSGQGTRRQGQINDSVIDTLDSSLQWLNDLSRELAQSNLAICKVNERVSDLVQQVSHLADVSFATREQLQKLTQTLCVRMHDMERRVQQVEMQQAAGIHLDSVFAKWAAGKFSDVSASARYYAALQELWWGDFGDCFRSCEKSRSTELLGTLMNKGITQLAQDVGIRPTDVCNTREIWLQAPPRDSHNDDMGQALAWLASDRSVDVSPFTVCVTRELSRQWPRQVPLLTTADRLVRAMTQEVFSHD